MSDYLVRGTAYDGQVRVFAARTTQLMEEIRRRHDLWPTASAALGRAVSATAMMGAMLKGEQSLTVQIKGSGPLGQIVVDANAKGEVRGYVTNPHTHFPLNEKGKLDVARAVGKPGYLYVIKDLGMREPYRGSVPLVSGEIGEDFTYYFAYSEQVPSAVGVGVLVEPDHSIRAAGGFIIQLLPDTEEKVISEIERRIAEIAPVSQMIDAGMTPEEILRQIVQGDVQIFSRLNLRFQCRCSAERVKSMLLSLGEKELREMVEEGKGAQVECHFCNEKFTLTQGELEDLLASLK
ncbi:redox-regulated molecular chaperone HslO [Bacillaceae bacterium]